MSQEDPSKYEMNQQQQRQQQQQHHYDHYQQYLHHSHSHNHHHHHYPPPQGSNGLLRLTMKYENKRSAIADGRNDNNNKDEKEHGPNDDDNSTFYENFSAKRGAVDKNPQNKHSHVVVDANQSKSTGVNNAYTVVANGSTTVATPAASNLNADYENLNFNRDLQLDKRILLQKYFRTALVGPRENIYENLCRGCNYGVFTARGPLCSFCECIVNGVTSIGASPAESSNNIYENICGHCAQFYSGNAEEDVCPCRKKVKELQVSFCEQAEDDEVIVEHQEKQVKSVENLIEIGSSELLLTSAELSEKKKVKIRKSKSFNKTVKPKILSNFWDTLRKPKVVRKPLEIVHHVDGHGQVFHTKETFDLKRICELKRSATSCSDQHIYGRLKPRDLNQSQEEFLSTQSLVQSEQKIKRSRVSKPKFLRSLSVESEPESVVVKSELELCNAQNPQYYLNPSVCLWMTSLRREVLNSGYRKINTCTLALGEEDSDGVLLCYPKSIPSKNLVNLSCKTIVAAPSRPQRLLSYAGEVTNQANIYESLEIRQRNASDYETASDIGISTEIVALRSHPSQPYCSNAAAESQEEIHHHQQQQQQVVTYSPQRDRDYYQQMVDEFILHLQNKQMKQQQHQKYDNMVNHGTMNTTGGVRGAVASHAEPTTTTIPLRQTSNSVGNHNKAKRQGMYLRLGEQHHDYERVLLNTTAESDRASDKNNNNCNKQLLICDNVNNRAVKNTVKGDQSTQGDFVKGLGHTPTMTSPEAEKRLGMHERHILQAFEALLQMEKENKMKQSMLAITSTLNSKESLVCEKQTLPLATYGVLTKKVQEKEEHKQQFCSSCSAPSSIIIVDDLIQQLLLSCSLNPIVLAYDKYLSLFLRRIVFSSSHHREKCKQKTHTQLARVFQRFCSHCRWELSMLHSYAQSSRPNSINAKLDLMKTHDGCKNGNANSKPYAIASTERGLKAIEQQREIPTINDSLRANDDGLETTATNVLKSPPTTITTTTESSLNSNRKTKTPPVVPKRDPTTKLSPTKEQLPPVPAQRTKMTVPSANQQASESSTKLEKSQEENIYQPIWKFKTVGEVQERFKTDADYYDIKELRKEKLGDVPEILISEEDHSEWEPDEEFVFSSQPRKPEEECDPMADKNSTIRSTRSNDSSIVTTSSLSGSTITDFASSTATLASCVSSSLMHHLFRNIGIFYSLTEPKLRAIIYDYDRIHSSRYFCKTQSNNNNNNISNNNNNNNNNDSGLGKSPTPQLTKKETPATVKENLPAINCASKSSESDATVTKPNKCHIPSSVEAWKLQLLNVSCMEDEEDMIVSESEILRAQTIKEDVEPQNQAQPQIFIQRFKSRSTDNILDLPLEDDKRSFGDRVRDKLQRGILNINNRSSPKSEKRLYKAMRNAQTTSLCLDEGIKPKYPIFEAPLSQLELNQTTCPNVPRFVVDSIEYIERKDRINQDGLYRACGNKFSIDELKLKISKPYNYDPTLIAADDIHTIASLLKQFFRDLPHPLIPQETYNCLARDLTLNEGIDAMRIAINEMPEPNKSTLAFLIKHLTNVAACSSSNRMHASNLAIVWGPSLFTLNEAKTYDIGRMNTLAKVLIENYNRIFQTNERLL